MKLKNKIIQLSCDGGAATGKSTGAKMISKKYKLKFLSSGLLYRYASFLLIKYKPKNIVETGVGAGFSSYAFLEAIKENK